MAADLKPVLWKRPPDRPKSPQNIIRFIHGSFDNPLINPKTNSSFLHSEKLNQNLSESRKTFLSWTCNDSLPPPPPPTPPDNTTPPIEINHDHKKVLSKKISFKTRKTTQIYRRNPLHTQKLTTSANKVAELTKKFNGMILDTTLVAEPSKQHSKTAIKKQDSVTSAQLSVSRKPSVKTKPAFNFEDKIVIVKKRPTIHRKPSRNLRTLSDNKISVRAKIAYLEKPQTVQAKEEPPVRPTNLPINISKPVAKREVSLGHGGGTVRRAIEIFERRSSEVADFIPKEQNVPKVPDKPISNVIVGSDQSEQTKREEPEKSQDKTDVDEIVQIINIPAALPQRRCDSMYETLNLKKPPHVLKVAKSEETISTTVEKSAIKPNTSFLWTLNHDKSPQATTNSLVDDDWKSTYDFVDPKAAEVPLPPKTFVRQIVTEEKIYEELNLNKDDDNYEYCSTAKSYEEVMVTITKPSPAQTQETDDGYEYCTSPDKENIYETLPPPPLLPRRQQNEPLPPRPPSRGSYCTIRNNEDTSNCYESIYNPDASSIAKGDAESNYESIYGCQMRIETASNRDSLVSSDQQSNSLYGRSSFLNWGDDGNPTYNGRATSDLSSSDKSDDWVDVTDNEDNAASNSGIIIIRERQKCKKSGGWSQQLREWSKLPKVDDQDSDNDADHHYETLCHTAEAEYMDDYDSFASDTESESSFHKTDSGVDIANNQLPEPPNNQTYVLTRLAATAGKHMKKLKTNWSVTKNDITKSLSRMTKRKSRTDLELAPAPAKAEVAPPTATSYQNLEFTPASQPESIETEKVKTLSRKGFLNKFRRSMSLSAESASELTSSLDSSKPKSTFYLTNDINIDEKSTAETNKDSGNFSISPVQTTSRSSIVRPQSPPPPIPQEVKPGNDKPPPLPVRRDKKATSWYAEVGLFKNSDNNISKRPNTFWYAEVGLYQPSESTPSTSSAENSGNNVKSEEIDQHNNEEYYNLKNDDYYNNSILSLSSNETKKDQFGSLTPELQLRLLDEPLYQFYDAAKLESACRDSSFDSDSDGYEEVGHDENGRRRSSRPSAMELVSPSLTRTLWCEIPEVIQSSVLSTLSGPQKKLQEAKFEMITSEASYLNSLNVLVNHFVSNLETCDLINQEELNVLFGKLTGVKSCSEKLLWDLEKCWQDNILLHGVCEIIQKHAEENFYVYVTYCENQILLDESLKKIKDRPGFTDILRKLESSSACQSLTLHSFLMLPMQRITRWPLLVDAVLRRLSAQDSEYLSCQYTLGTLNKIVNQCNEGARKKERENEMKKISTQLEFPKGVQPIEIASDDRWLIRSGAVTHMQQRTDEIKLTFGKRFIKSTLHLFLFNDLLFVTKQKSENTYTVLHYCARSLVELNSTDLIASFPIKDTQGRHLLFTTLLENQNEKTVEFLFSCASESDKERWIEALTPPKSEDPDETLYGCWDCPQVTAIHNYVASQPDELALNKGDVINVLRKMADGWYHGERIRDGQMGWFPANYTVEIANPHVKSRNLKQRYRLLAFSKNYLKTK